MGDNPGDVIIAHPSVLHGGGPTLSSGKEELSRSESMVMISVMPLGQTRSQLFL